MLGKEVFRHTDTPLSSWAYEEGVFGPTAMGSSNLALAEGARLMGTHVCVCGGVHIPFIASL